jgi:hypothetical protein
MGSLRPGLVLTGILDHLEGILSPMVYVQLEERINGTVALKVWKEELGPSWSSLWTPSM